MNRFNVVRYTAFAIEMLLCYILQSTPGLQLELFGGSPVLLVPLALSISVFEDDVPAVIFGLICGLMADSGYSGPMGYYSICLCILCFITSVLMENYIRTNLLSAFIIGTISVPLIIFLQFVLFYIAMGYSSVWEYFISHILSRMIFTWAFVPVFYGLNRFIAAKTKES